MAAIALTTLLYPGDDMGWVELLVFLLSTILFVVVVVWIIFKLLIEKIDQINLLKQAKSELVIA